MDHHGRRRRPLQTRLQQPQHLEPEIQPRLGQGPRLQPLPQVSVRENEIAFYITKLNRYGLPLDSRADYTKLDWTLWTATLASDPAQFKAIVDPLYLWLNETPTRVPLTDWYDTKTGKQVGFQARSVVGGLFIKALSDKSLTEKWRSYDSATK